MTSMNQKWNRANCHIHMWKKVQNRAEVVKAAANLSPEKDLKQNHHHHLLLQLASKHFGGLDLKECCEEDEYLDVSDYSKENTSDFSMMGICDVRKYGLFNEAAFKIVCHPKNVHTV